MIATFLLSNWKPIAIVAGCAIVFGAWQLDRTHQYRAGVTAERAAAVARTAELLKMRAQDNTILRNMDDASLCLELGGAAYVDGECR